MVTVIRIEMSEGVRKALGKHITGKSKPATRRDIEAWASRLLGSTLETIMSEEAASSSAAGDDPAA